MSKTKSHFSKWFGKITGTVLLFWGVVIFDHVSPSVSAQQVSASNVPGASLKESVDLPGHFDGRSVWQFRVPRANR